MANTFLAPRAPDPWFASTKSAKLRPPAGAEARLRFSESRLNSRGAFHPFVSCAVHRPAKVVKPSEPNLHHSPFVLRFANRSGAITVRALAAASRTLLSPSCKRRSRAGTASRAPGPSVPIEWIALRRTEISGSSKPLRRIGSASAPSMRQSALASSSLRRRTGRPIDRVAFRIRRTRPKPCGVRRYQHPRPTPVAAAASRSD
jgi:hypothetical protein